MVKALIGSLGAAALLGAGLIAGPATASGSEASPRSDGQGCIEGKCAATIECKDGGCVIEWTGADGKTGVIELSCQDGECRVVRCEPACGAECLPASATATSSSCCSK